jgi:hypothetical protein
MEVVGEVGVGELSGVEESSDLCVGARRGTRGCKVKMGRDRQGERCKVGDSPVCKGRRQGLQKIVHLAAQGGRPEAWLSATKTCLHDERRLMDGPGNSRLAEGIHLAGHGGLRRVSHRHVGGVR